MSNKIKKILTVDDLVKFCQEQKFARFSSKDTGYQLAVKVPTTFEVEGSDDNHRDMTKLKIKIFHTGINRNNSKVSKEAAEKAMKTIPDRPVLAAIHQLSNGDYDFAGHEIEIVHNDKTGKDEVCYIESQVGSFSSEPAFWEHDDELDKDFVCAYAYISNEYTRTSEIINRKGYTKNSCELFIDEMAYDGKEHCLDLIDFYVSGSTLLGTSMDENEKEIEEGMQGSRADIADFSAENNSVKFSKDEKLIELLDKLNTTLSNFNNNTIRKEEEIEVENKENFEEVTETVEVTETEETTEEEVTVTENESEETVDETSEDETVDTEEETTQIKEENACGGGSGSKKKKKNSAENEPMTRTYEISHDDIRYALYNLLSSYEVDGETKKFAVSLQEKIYAIQDLVNATYAEADNTYYGVSVYEDYVVMCDYWSGRYYKQSYTSENDNYSLTGDRVEVYAEFVTSDEQKELDAMRSNYAALKEFKETAEKNELHAKREEINKSEKYEAVSDTEAFKELVKNMDNYSLEELEKEAKIIFADNFNMETFAAHTEKAQKNSTVKVFANVNKSKKDSRYGNLFSK